jgi:hypothetical protein
LREDTLANHGRGFEIHGSTIVAWVGNRWVIAGYFTHKGPDQPRSFGAFIQQTGDRANQWLKKQLTDMAVATGGAAIGGLVTGVVRSGVAAEEVLGIGRVASTLEFKFGARASIVRQVISGKQPLSVLSAQERARAASYYRSVAARTGGTHASAAARYNIARAEFLEGTRVSLSRTLPEFIKNGFR